MFVVAPCMFFVAFTHFFSYVCWFSCICCCLWLCVVVFGFSDEVDVWLRVVVLCLNWCCYIGVVVVLCIYVSCMRCCCVC